MDAIHPEESVSYCAASVAAGGNEHVHLLLAFLTDEVLQQSCHESCAHIFECECRSVEEFEAVDILLHLHYWAVELKGVVNDVLQVVFIDVFSEESLCHGECDLLERQLVDIVEKLLWQRLYAFGHIKAAVARQSLYYRLVQGSHGSLFVCTVVFHCCLLSTNIRCL